MTEDVWSYKSTAGHPAGAELTGYKVEAIDGGIGKVDKYSDAVGDAYLVVDTGVWIFGKEVLIPAGAVVRVDPDDRTIHVDRTKEQIKNAPEFHRETHLDDPDYRRQLGTHYYGLGGPFGPMV
ncbi:PRC-barrel domain containing protein [Streptomyces sp. NPDC012769]|uniref:PRC-barrel domain containing protein n=1 Tax=Streptomyces sp. NPDC012769 TaxID=3364848 RepID=UPI00367A121D